jgi:hypothetical protein
MASSINLEIAIENGALLFRTADLRNLQYLVIHDTIDGFPVRRLGIGTEFTILPNDTGGEGMYRVTDIRTYISTMPVPEDPGKLSDKFSLNLSYIVEKI